jgi:hypothetical protein
MNSNGRAGGILASARRRFETWRRGRSRGSRIPEELWEAAVQAAREQGISKTSQKLHLDYYALHRRVKKATRTAPRKPRRGRKPAPPAEEQAVEFLELPQRVLSAGPVAIVELGDQTTRRLRVELRGMDAGGVASVARALWERGG